ncbi:MAG: hypothetical protein GXX83_11160 [Gaiellales bacterium]|nr:hypothetical protein [Gaiellales bacterium]
MYDLVPDGPVTSNTVGPPVVVVAVVVVVARVVVVADWLVPVAAPWVVLEPPVTVLRLVDVDSEVVTVPVTETPDEELEPASATATVDVEGFLSVQGLARTVVAGGFDVLVVTTSSEASVATVSKTPSAESPHPMQANTPTTRKTSNAIPAYLTHPPRSRPARAL